MGAPFGAGHMADGILTATDNLSAAPLVASITIANGEVRAGAAGIEAEPLNAWTCGPGGQDCTPTADSARGAYALKVVRDTKM
jgi:hypothetical protein